MDPDMGTIDPGAVPTEIGKALVSAMRTAEWTTVRPHVARVFTQAQADHLVGALVADTAALAAGQLSVEVAIGRWEGRMEALLFGRPELIGQLRGLLNGVAPATGSSGNTVNTQVAGDRNQVTTAGRDVVHSQHRTTKRNHYGGIGIVIVVVAMLLFGGGALINYVIVPGFQGSGIAADTLCRDYLQAPQWEREQAARKIGVELGASGAGHPFMPLNVEDSCGRQPDTPIGEIIGRQDY